MSSIYFDLFTSQIRLLMDNIYVNRMNDMNDNMTIQYDNMTVTICHDKETRRYASQCI